VQRDFRVDQSIILKMWFLENKKCYNQWWNIN